MAGVTVQDVQSWLRSYGELQTALENQRERLDMLRSRMKAPKSATPTVMPRGGGDRVDRIGAELAYLEELEEKLLQNQTAARALYRQIDGTISQISGPGWPDRRFVLRARYLDGCRWEEVSEMLFHRKSDYEGKEDTYLRHTFAIHKKALGDLLEIYIELLKGSSDHGYISE